MSRVGDELQAKHKMMWLHPGRPLQYLFLLYDNEIIWSDGVKCSPPNGQYDYVPNMYENNDANPLDGWFVRFHYLGDSDRAQGTLLERVPGSVSAWRAMGTLENEFELKYARYGCRDVRQWHIVMVAF